MRIDLIDSRAANVNSVFEMKNITACIASIWLCFPLFVIAGETITTLKGKVLENAEMKSFDSQSVLIRHSGGVVRIPMEELSKKIRKQLNVKPGFSLIRADYERSVIAAKGPLSVLDEQYRVHLEKNEKEAQLGGMLERVLLIRKERAAFVKGEAVDYSSFLKLKQMRAVYDDNRKKRKEKGIEKIKAVLVVYSLELKELEVELTKAGDLEGAGNARKEQEKSKKLRENQTELLALFDNPKEVKVKENPTSIAGYYALVTSIASELVASVNLETGETKILYRFEEKSGPKGIAVSQAGAIYVGLRYGGQNVVKLMPKTGGGFESSVLIPQVGLQGAANLRISGRGVLLTACAVAGTVKRYDLNRSKPMPTIMMPGMEDLAGIDVFGDNLYAVEVFGGRIAKFKLNSPNPEGEWLIKSKSEHLKIATGIAVGYNGNLFVANNDKTTIPEFSVKTGAFSSVFFDTLSVGRGPIRSADIIYTPALKAYFISSVGIFSVDTEGKLIREYTMPRTIQGVWGISVIHKNQVSKLLGDQL